jgi:hypothetical protein
VGKRHYSYRRIGHHYGQRKKSVKQGIDAHFYIGEYDVLYDSYAVLKNDTSSGLFIDLYDPASKRLTGHFSYTMYRTTPLSQPADLGYADTLHFTDGKFDLVIK